MDNFSQLLDSLQISHIISIDDENTLNDESSSYNTITLEENGIVSQLADKDKERLADSGALMLGDIKDALPDIYQKILQSITQGGKSVSALSFINNHFATMRGPAFISLSEFQRDKIPQEYKNVIWFLDKEMDGGDVLPRIIPSIADLGVGAHIIMLLTTDRTLLRLNESWDNRYLYLQGILDNEQQAEKAAYCLYVIAKSEIEEKLRINDNAARQLLHNRVADSLIGYSAYHINELLGSFAIETQRQLDEIAKNLTLASLETLNYNMNFEGSTNIYCAFREIQSLLQEKQYTSRFSECAPYISAMKKMRVPTGSEESLVKSNISRFLKAFEWTKFQILHSDCNNSFADIAYGDLFRLHQDDQCYIGIVVTQSCDCVLRKASNGTVSRNALSFSMILYPEKIEIIHSLSDLQFSNETIRKLRDCGVIYSLEGNESSGYTMKYIRTDETHGRIAQFKPFILDLASLNPEGFCAVGNIDNILDIVKQEKVEVWSKYGQVLLNEVRAARNRIQTLSDRMGEEAGEIIEDLYGVPFDLQNQSFKMQRVGQLTPNLVELVYRGFLSHFYRVGRNPVTALQTDG